MAGSTLKQLPTQFRALTTAQRSVLSDDAQYIYATVFNGLPVGERVDSDDITRAVQPLGWSVLRAVVATRELVEFGIVFDENEKPTDDGNIRFYLPDFRQMTAADKYKYDETTLRCLPIFRAKGITPRDWFTPETLDELSASLVEHGGVVVTAGSAFGDEEEMAAEARSILDGTSCPKCGVVHSLEDFLRMVNDDLIASGSAPISAESLHQRLERLVNRGETTSALEDPDAPAGDGLERVKYFMERFAEDDPAVILARVGGLMGALTRAAEQIRNEAADEKAATAGRALARRMDGIVGAVMALGEKYEALVFPSPAEK